MKHFFIISFLGLRNSPAKVFRRVAVYYFNNTLWLVAISLALTLLLETPS